MGTWLTTRDWVYRNSKRYPNKLAIANGPVRYTFSQFAERCNRLANALLSKGLQKGDRVAFIDRTCPWYLEFYFGISLGGMIAVPINWRLAPREIIYILNNCRPKALIVGKDYISVVNEIRSEVPSIDYFISMVPAEGYELYEQIIRQSDPGEPSTQVSAEDVAVLCYTSGTTAVPKGAMLTHRSIGASGVNMNLGISLTPDDIVYYPAPLFHVMGCMAMSMMAMSCTMVFEDFAPQTMVETIERERPSLVVTTAGPYTMLVNADLDRSKYDITSVRKALAGGSPMRKRVAVDLFNFFPKLENLYFCFSLTEASPFVTVGLAATRRDIEEDRYHEDSGAEGYLTLTKIVDDNDNELPPGQPGEVIVYGPMVMNGYWEMPDETAEALRGGWLHTGDIGYYDERGRLWIVDRKKDMILTGSENVASAEVESVLYRHPAIADAAVIGVPDEKWGERVHAVVVLKPGQKVTAQEITDFCRGYLAGYKIPRSVEFVDALPRNPAGKVLKTELRAKYKKVDKVPS